MTSPHEVSRSYHCPPVQDPKFKRDSGQDHPLAGFVVGKDPDFVDPRLAERHVAKAEHHIGRLKSLRCREFHCRDPTPSHDTRLSVVHQMSQLDTQFKLAQAPGELSVDPKFLGPEWETHFRWKGDRVPGGGQTPTLKFKIENGVIARKEQVDDRTDAVCHTWPLQPIS